MNEIAVETGRMASVEELMKILAGFNMFYEQQQMSLLMKHIAETEKNHTEVMQELADIKAQLNELMSKSESGLSKSKRFFTKLVEQAENIAETQSQKLQGIKQDLNQKARQAVRNVKDTGIKALSNICGVLGIQEKLIVLRDQERSAETDMKLAIEKMDGIEAELLGAASHIRNAGKIAAGREKAIPDQNQKDSKGLLQMLRKHYQKRQAVHAARAKKLSGVIEKFRALEQKASVLEKLSDNRERIAEKDKAEADNRQLPSTEHKRDENIR